MPEVQERMVGSPQKDCHDLRRVQGQDQGNAEER